MLLVGHALGRTLAGVIISLTTLASGPASLKALGEENAPQKGAGLCSGCSDERCPIKGRGLLPVCVLY